MRTQYRIAEKNALFIGPVTRHLSQTALRMAEEGCDVAIATPDFKMGENLCNAISDLKEIDSSSGRAMCLPLTTPESRDPSAIMKAVATQFGGLDILFEMTDDDPTPAVEQALVYIKNRRHGRILIVRPLLTDIKIADLSSLQNFNQLPSYLKLNSLVAKWAREFHPPQLTINGIVVGPTEELLARLYPTAGPTSAALKELQKHLPAVNIADANDVAEMLTYLGSTLSNAIHGQVMPLIQGPLSAN
jgi:hypothetical protein